VHGKIQQFPVSLLLVRSSQLTLKAAIFTTARAIVAVPYSALAIPLLRFGQLMTERELEKALWRMRSLSLAFASIMSSRAMGALVQEDLEGASGVKGLRSRCLDGKSF